MKTKYDVLANSSNLKLLIGSDLGFEFPLKYPNSEDPKKKKIKTSCSLSFIIKSTGHKRIRSYDPLLDGMHPIEIAIDNIERNGLTREWVYKILKNKASVTQKKIKGQAAFLEHFLTDEKRDEIICKLKEVSINKYGQFIRNGTVF